MKNLLSLLLLSGIVFGFLLLTAKVDCATTLEGNEGRNRLLPDSAFALVETEAGGNRIRHLPYRDSHGEVDIERLIYALGTFAEEKWLSQENQDKAKKILESHYEKFMADAEKQGLSEAAVSLNRAGLSELVRLPGIGPVLAVKILSYRSNNNPFTSIDDIKKVDGIGSSTFRAIRFYINVD